jgi:hypothetical protein
MPGCATARPRPEILGIVMPRCATARPRPEILGDMASLEPGIVRYESFHSRNRRPATIFDDGSRRTRSFVEEASFSMMGHVGLVRSWRKVMPDSFVRGGRVTSDSFVRGGSVTSDSFVRGGSIRAQPRRAADTAMSLRYGRLATLEYLLWQNQMPWNRRWCHRRFSPHTPARWQDGRPKDGTMTQSGPGLCLSVETCSCQLHAFRRRDRDGKSSRSKKTRRFTTCSEGNTIVDGPNRA